MMYFFVRLVVIIIIILCYIVLIKNVKIRLTSKQKRICIVVIFAFWIIFSSIPFEMNLIAFASARDAFNYSHVGQNILYSIETEDCTYILSTKDSDVPQLHLSYMRKISDKWRYESPYSFIYIDAFFSDMYYINRIRNHICDEIMIICEIIMIDSDMNIDIKDNENSKFETFDIHIKNSRYTYRYYYTRFEPNDSEYHLYLNGETIIFK